MSLSFKKIMNKVIVFLFLLNNITNSIFGNKICFGKKSNGYSGKNKNEYEKLDTQDTSTTEQKAEGKSKESEESELKEKQKQKELEEKKQKDEQRQKELEKQREKEFEEQTQLENSKQDFTNRFNKINTEIVNLINHKNNKFEIKKEKNLTVTLEEINALKFEEIENFKKKIKKFEDNFNKLITDLVNKLKTKFDNLKGKEIDTIKLDIEENIFLNLKESSKIIEIDNKLTNFEKAITDGKDGILKDLIPIYNNLLPKEKKINILVTEEKYKFDFKTNTLDLIKTKEITELLEIKTKLDNLKSIYDGIINKKSNDSKIKYSNLNTIITNYNKFFTDSNFVISEINEEAFKVENYEEKYEEIDKNITNIETSLNNEFNEKLVALNKERSEKNKKLEGLGQSKIDEFEFKENENLNSKFTNLKNFKDTLNTKDELIKNQIKNKKDDCTNKLNVIKKNKSDDILDDFIDKFDEISNNINSLESNDDCNNIIKTIENLQTEILEKIEEKRKEEEKRQEEEKKKKEIEDFISKYKDKTITNYNDFEEAFSSVKNIYDKINEENKDINKILENLINNVELKIDKQFSGNLMVLPHLGAGSFGTVYKYTEDKEEFALKEINFEKIYNFEEKNKKKKEKKEELKEEDKVEIRKKYLKLFEKEIKYLLLFKGYNNISQITDVYKMDSSYLYSTKCYKNGDLKKNLGKLSDKDIINIMYELIIALRNIHKNGVVHCDIKPGNILLDENNKAYIGDFGFSQFGDNLKLKGGDSLYMSKEKVQKNFSRRKSDLYALLICFVSLIEKKIYSIHQKINVKTFMFI